MTTSICDSNVILALTLSHHVHHRPALEWLDAVSRRQSVLLCRVVQMSVLRLLSTAAVLAPYGNQPLTNAQAWAVWEAIESDDRFISRDDEPTGLAQQWHAFADRPTASPKLWMDAYLAAYATAAGCQMVTTDSGFDQFDGLDLKLIE